MTRHTNVQVALIGWFAIPASIVVGFFLIGLDDAAVELENPFGAAPPCRPFPRPRPLPAVVRRLQP